MTVTVKISTPNNKQARVTHGADVYVVEPGQNREFYVHEDNPTLTVLEQSVPGVSTRGGGNGNGPPR